MSENRGPKETGVEWVERVMRQRIAAGMYPVGKALPFTAALSEEFGVGPFTISRAMRNMNDLLENHRAGGRVLMRTGVPAGGTAPDAPVSKPVPKPGPYKKPEAKTQPEIVEAPTPHEPGQVKEDGARQVVPPPPKASFNAECELERFRIIGMRKTDRDPHVLMELWADLASSAVRYDGTMIVYGPLHMDPDLARMLADNLYEMAEHAEEMEDVVYDPGLG